MTIVFVPSLSFFLYKKRVFFIVVIKSTTDKYKECNVTNVSYFTANIEKNWNYFGAKEANHES